MKTLLLLLPLLPICASTSLAAPPSEKSETWISPRAQALVDRVRAAHRGASGWTSTVVSVTRSGPDGGEKTLELRMSERFLAVPGSTGYYASTNYAPNVGAQFVKWQDDTLQRILARGPNGLVAQSQLPDDTHRPEVWTHFEASLNGAKYVRYAGREDVVGQGCDVLEMTSVRSTPASGVGPESVSGITVARFYVGSKGFIERRTLASDAKSASESFWQDVRITYDAAAKLTPADFDTANFERAAAEVLRGEPMPAWEERLFLRGHVLPETTFIAWADGKPFRMAELKGKVVVLETWTSWCHFCKEAFPFYEKMRKALAGQDVVFVAVSFDAKKSEYEAWMNKNGGEYGFKFGRVDSADPMKTMKEFKGSLPAFYVLGRDGRIVASYLGYGYRRDGEDPRLLTALREAGVKI